jgi:putative membrane protein
MRNTLLIASVATLSLALAGCGNSQEQAGDNLTTANEVGSIDNMAMTNMGDADMAGANGMAATPAPTTAQDYATQAAAADLFEIESSKLAANQAEDAKLKAFAKMLVADHTKSSNELKTIAASLQPAVTVTPTLRPDMQSKIDQLRDAKGADFDRLYATQQVAAHQEALALHRGFASAGQDEQLKTFASKTADVVQKHLTEAQGMAQ